MRFLNLQGEFYLMGEEDLQEKVLPITNSIKKRIKLFLVLIVKIGAAYVCESSSILSTVSGKSRHTLFPHFFRFGTTLGIEYVSRF